MEGAGFCLIEVPSWFANRMGGIELNEGRTPGKGRGFFLRSIISSLGRKANISALLCGKCACH